MLQSNLRSGNLLRFAIRDESVRLHDGKLEILDLQFVLKANRLRAFADSYSKVSRKHALSSAQLLFEMLMVI